MTSDDEVEEPAQSTMANTGGMTPKALSMDDDAQVDVSTVDKATVSGLSNADLPAAPRAAVDPAPADNHIPATMSSMPANNSTRKNKSKKDARQDQIKNSAGRGKMPSIPAPQTDPDVAKSSQSAETPVAEAMDVDPGLPAETATSAAPSQASIPETSKKVDQSARRMRKGDVPDTADPKRAKTNSGLDRKSKSGTPAIDSSTPKDKPAKVDHGEKAGEGTPNPIAAAEKVKRPKDSRSATAQPSKAREPVRPDRGKDAAFTAGVKGKEKASGTPRDSTGQDPNAGPKRAVTQQPVKKKPTPNMGGAAAVGIAGPSSMSFLQQTLASLQGGDTPRRDNGKSKVSAYLSQHPLSLFVWRKHGYGYPCL